MSSLSYLKKLPRPLLATLGLLCLPALSQAQHAIFDGSSFGTFYGTVPTLDTTDWSPNSSVQASIKVTSGAWSQTSFGATGSTINPMDVDWSATSPDRPALSFDYKVNGSASSIYVVQLQWFGAGQNLPVAHHEFPGGTNLIADGEWHTFTVPITDWTSNYYDNTGGWDLTAPKQWRIRIQPAASGLNDVNFDNVTVIPEPGTYAAIFGVSFLGLALWVRRRRQA